MMVLLVNYVKGLEKGGEELTKGVKNYEAKQIEKGYATSQKGKVSKYPTEERQVKFYRADGTEEIHTIKQAKNAGNFVKGESNKSIARTGEIKGTKALKTAGEAFGLAGDAIDMATLLKAYSEGDISAVLAAAPFGLGLIFEDQIKEIDAQHLEKAIELGFLETESLITPPSSYENMEFIFTNEEDALNLLSGNIKSLEDLSGFKNGYTIFDKSNRFGILITRTKDNISVNAIFYNQNGFE